MDTFHEWNETKGHIYRGTTWPQDWGPAPQRKSATAKTGRVLEGLAVVYGKIHRFDERFEVFQKGCFNESLNSRIHFYIDHKSEDCIGDTDSNLELFDCDEGLAFRLALSERDLKELDGRERMSPSYFVEDDEEQTIDGKTVRIIKRARLQEISSVRQGAIWQAFSRVREANEIGPLHDDIKSIVACQPEAPDIPKLLKRYSDHLHAEARRQVMRVY
jgi:HK97 family phage prohead protease